jgi:hypothetical protein
LHPTAQMDPSPSQTVNITVNPGRSWSFCKKCLAVLNIT